MEQICMGILICGDVNFIFSCRAMNIDFIDVLFAKCRKEVVTDSITQIV